MLLAKFGARSPPTTPSGCGAKMHNLRTVTLGLCLAFHMLSCVISIKSLNLSFLIWTMGTMMIIPPLDACVPAKNKWPWEVFLGSWVWNIYELFCHLGRRKSSVCKLWLPSPRLTIDSSQMTSISEPWPRTLTELMLLFSRPQQELMITGSYCCSQPYQSAFPCQLLLTWIHTARRVVRLWSLFSFPHLQCSKR